MTDPLAALRASLREQMVALRGDAPDAHVDVVVERLDSGLLRAKPRSFDAVREADALLGGGRPTPYWSSAWPSGTVLTSAIAAAPQAFDGARVLELGCGIGMPAVAAARAGAEVLATDACPEAVVYGAHNLALNDLAGDVAVAGWDAVGALGVDRFDVVIAADVLYTQANAAALGPLLDQLLTGDGAAWIADPGRAGAKDFLATARHTWSLQTDRHGDVAVHRLSRRASRR